MSEPSGILYALARPLLFALDAESAHALTLGFADAPLRLGLLRAPAVPPLPVRAMGLDFPNPVGLAAGLDKNAEHIDALARLGFGFIEVGTVTPRPQPGNPRPRLFRLVSAEALINRFGFNNVGLDAFMANLERSQWRGIVGVNIGRNFDTPNERAADDYATCLARVYPRAGYIVINVSSPNTTGLRALQERAELDALLARLAEPQIADIADAVRRQRIDALIATNTSLARDGVEGLPHATERGGLSGAPIRARATRTLAAFAARLGGEVALIGVGGIVRGADAAEKIAAGASLVQLYTGLVYRGPALVAECVRSLTDAHRAAA